MKSLLLKINPTKTSLLTALLLAMLAMQAQAKETDPTPPAGDLAKSFATPPDSARPWVYWFPLNGNLTKEGITADFEAMARVGIGGVLYMEVDQGAPKGPADFGGPLWRELFTHACNEAHRLAAEFVARENIPTDDLYALEIDHPEHSADGVHFKTEAKTTQGKQVAKFIGEALASLPSGK